MDAAVAFAKNAVKTRYEDIPPEALRAAKVDVLDTLGTALAGSTAAGGREIVALVKEWGGKKEATIIGAGGKAPAVSAALANGAMAHALDYDEAHENAHLHAGVSTIPVAMAVAERDGGVTGEEFLTAVALGIDVICRMGLANPAGPEAFILTAVYGYFGSAITAGRLLGLDEEQLVSALGIAYAQAAGNHQCVDDGAQTKRMQVGFAAKGGLVAALMAQKGVIGATNSLEGKSGLYNAYHAGRYNPEFLTQELGKRFESANLSFKPYPCCRFGHAHVDAALALATEHDIRPDEIQSISAYVNREPHVLCDPLEVKRNPRTPVDAQFSIPYAVATALVKRAVKISDFTPAAIADAVIIGVANKVTPVLDLSLRSHEPPAALLDVKTRRGTFTKRVEYALGHPQNPMSAEALAAKFRDCASYSVRPFSPRRLSVIIDTVGRLEELADMEELFQLLRRRS